jgi:hypothetical protein
MPLWKTWMDDEAYKTFTKHGYYSKYLPLDTPTQVKMISINTDSCDSLNHFTWSELADPNGLFEFVSKELADVESKGHFAVLISHIPPDECTH